MRAITLIVCLGLILWIAFIALCVLTIVRRWNDNSIECDLQSPPKSTHLLLYCVVLTSTNILNTFIIPFGAAFVRPYPKLTLGNAFLFTFHWIFPAVLGVWGYLETVEWVCVGVKRQTIWTLSVIGATVNTAYVAWQGLLELWMFERAQRVAVAPSGLF
jgi:hypothetical protein